MLPTVIRMIPEYSGTSLEALDVDIKSQWKAKPLRPCINAKSTQAVA
jgi:hypothetical protein